LTKAASDHILYITVRAKGKQMKRFLIDTASNTMTAACIAGVLLCGAATQAKAGPSEHELKNMLKAVVIGAVVKEVFYNGERGRGLGAANPYGSEYNPINERHRPGYAAGANDPRVVCGTKVIRHQNYAEQVKVNCFGQVLSTRIIRR